MCVRARACFMLYSYYLINDVECSKSVSHAGFHCSWSLVAWCAVCEQIINRIVVCVDALIKCETIFFADGRLLQKRCRYVHRWHCRRRRSKRCCFTSTVYISVQLRCKILCSQLKLNIFLVLRVFLRAFLMTLKSVSNRSVWLKKNQTRPTSTAHSCLQCELIHWLYSVSGVQPIWKD